MEKTNSGTERRKCVCPAHTTSHQKDLPDAPGSRESSELYVNDSLSDTGPHSASWDLTVTQFISPLTTPFTKASFKVNNDLWPQIEQPICVSHVSWVEHQVKNEWMPAQVCGWNGQMDGRASKLINELINHLWALPIWFPFTRFKHIEKIIICMQSREKVTHKTNLYHR